MKEVLFISNRLNSNNKNGAFLCAKRNYEFFKGNFEEKVDIYVIQNKLKMERIINLFIFNRLEEININDEKKIITKILENKYNYIFFDGSNFGYCAEKIKQKFPRIKIIVFCHDITYELYKSLYLNSFEILTKLKYKKLMKNALINEIKMFKNSDKIITLNKRDSENLERIYKVKSDIEIPISLKEGKISKSNKNENFKILFIGVGNYLPNLLGIKFFILEVLNHIQGEFLVVGKGTEIYKKELENLNSKVRVMGTVNELDEYYNDVDIVVAPIFMGGGMKVKTAEALSYGKTIFGTKEAFEGYDLDYNKIGGLCDTAQEFILKIKKYQKWWEMNDKPKFNKYSFEMFKEKYSYNASNIKFNKIMNELK